MDKISYSLEPRRENAEQCREDAEQPRETPRPCNLPRTISPDMLLAPAIFGFAIFSMGFAAGAMWMGWFSR